MIPGETDDARLNEFDADEWFDVCRRIRPDLTREEFDEKWLEFIAAKRRRQAS